jgi:Phage portal protein, SPP1 Gp6-like
MFDTICDLMPRDLDYPERTRILDILGRVLDGRLYDVLPYRFHDERGAGGEYIPLRSRRPSVRYPLCKIVVEDSVSLLFSEGHFPVIDCPDASARAILSNISKESRLNLVMIDAAVRGSVGSVAILLRVLRGRIFFDVIDTMYLSPVWDADAPDTLALVTERYKVPGVLLNANGYSVDDADAEYWFCRQWDKESEVWFVPTQVGATSRPITDDNRTVRHGLGFVPMVWIRNLPGTSSSKSPNEGACTFRAAIETQIEIDYQLSQAGRGLKYSSDPTLLLKEPAIISGELVRGAGNALVVGEKGDARLLEIGGTASAAVIEYVRTLREFALEAVHGNRSSPDRLTTAQSGKALELMNQGLLWLADNLRITYGEVALASLVRMVIRASQIYRLRVMGEEVPPLDPAGPLSLKWPSWYPSSADDRQKDAQTLATLTASGLISRETAVKVICGTYDVDDPSDELTRIISDS